MFTPYLFDPTSRKTVADQVDYNSKLDSAKANLQRDMRMYVTDSELELFSQKHDLLSDSDKTLDLLRSCCELVTRALIRDEGVSREMAGAFITAGLGSEEKLLPSFNDLADSTLPANRQLLKTAAILHSDLIRTIFIAAMELNQQDYRSFFPERVCVHSPELVLKRLKNADFQPSAVERKQHLLSNREMAFSILNSLSIWEISDLVPMESMQVLQNAGRYNVLKEIFTNLDAKNDTEPATPVALKDELDGEDI